jgi:hypothetical protein
MNKLQLEKLGIHFVGNRAYPNRYIVDGLLEDNEVEIPNYYEIKDIFQLVYEIGLEKGIKLGQIKKTNQIKDILNISYEANI